MCLFLQESTSFKGNRRNVMMIMLHNAAFLGLIALAAGLSLYIWSLSSKGVAKDLTKIFGILIVLVSLFGLFCLTYYGIQYWKEGYFEAPMGKMQNMPMSQKGKQRN